jgi:hypothetical protein
MPPFGSVFAESRRSALLRRIDALAADAPRRWGRMSAHQAVCHLNDSLRAILGERAGAPQTVGVKRRVVRFVAFTLPFRWPHGVRTAPELDQQREGTPPGAFERDRAELKALLERIAGTGGRDLPRHYIWGQLTPGEAGRYAYRHVDHHLRQFGA